MQVVCLDSQYGFAIVLWQGSSTAPAMNSMCNVRVVLPLERELFGRVEGVAWEGELYEYGHGINITSAQRSRCCFSVI